MDKSFVKSYFEDLQEGPLRLLEPLEQEIFCQQVEQYWGDVVRPLSIDAIPIAIL